MKKILALVCGLVLCLSMAACGSNDDKTTSSANESNSTAVSSVAEDSNESTAEESTADSQSQNGGASKAEDDSSAENLNTEVKTVEDFIEQNKSTFDTLNKTLENSGISLEIFARDNSLVYSYKYTMDTVKNNDATKKSLETAMKSQESTFNSAFQSVKAIVPDAKSVIVEYLDSKGELIKSFEFK